MDFAKLEETAYRLMGQRMSHMEREFGAAFFHCRRVSHGILQLRRQVTDDSSHDEILRAAGLFHDVAKGLEPHPHYGALLARDIFAAETDAECCAEIARLISLHAARKRPETPCDDWVKLLQDADLLDHYGSYDVFMACAYHLTRREGLSEVAAFYRDGYPEQVAAHRALLNFDAARAIFDEKVAFETMLADRLQTEKDGGYLVK